MSRRTIELTERLHAYLLDTSLRETDVARRLREETAGLEKANMQISPEQGQLMALLVELMGARRVLEIGTFTGYSTLAMAAALPEDGWIVACDVSEEWTGVGERYWTEAGVRDRIDLRIAPALETLDALVQDGAAGTFDFAFIDADKGNIRSYYERCLDLVRQGGLIAVDNTLWSGRVADDSDHDDDTRTLRELNTHIHRDRRVSISLVPIGDGLTLAMKR